MNPLAILVAAAAYWVLGSLWYSMLFSEIWSKGLEAQGITIKEPTSGQLRTKMLLTFVSNLAAAAALAWILNLIGVESVGAAVPVGIVAGLGLGGSAIGVAYTWESKRAPVFLVDAGYHTVGCTIAAVILGAWR